MNIQVTTPNSGGNYSQGGAQLINPFSVGVSNTPGGFVNSPFSSEGGLSTPGGQFFGGVNGSLGMDERMFLQDHGANGIEWATATGDGSCYQTPSSIADGGSFIWATSTNPPSTIPHATPMFSTAITSDNNGGIMWGNPSDSHESDQHNHLLSDSDLNGDIEGVQWPQAMADGQEPDWSSQGGNVEVDQTPLQNQIQKNKESLELKLQLRRPMTALVEQGIMPQYKTSPSLHAQRTKLERAQMGDKLRQKIASRPDRQELVHRHILEDVRPDVDPSLCSRQRQLKRAKLADSLATQLSHRPGPLELIQKNILHTDDPVEQLVKQGSIAFTPTAQGTPVKPPPTICSADGSPSTILEDGEYDSDATVPSPSPLLSPPMFMAVSTTSGTAATAVTQPLNNSQQLSNSQLPDLAALTTLTTTTSVLTSAVSTTPLTANGQSSTTVAGLTFANGDVIFSRLISTPGDSGISLHNSKQSKSSRSESLGDIATSLSSSDLQLLARSGSFASPSSLVDQDSISNISGFSEASAGDNSVIVAAAAASSPVHRVGTPAAQQPQPLNSNAAVASFRPVTSTPFSNLSELNGPSLQREAPGKDRKKIKMKKPSTAPKPRTIKFHEYKGPESSLKRKIDEKGDKGCSGQGSKSGSGNPGETAYDLLLKQQQLFLQWQLENQNKYPQILLPATSRSSLMSLGSSSSPSLIGSSSVSLNSSSQASSCAPSPGSSRPSTPRSSTPIRSGLLTPQDVNHATSLLNRLDDMKVTELKMELKKRGLVVSGPKPVLVDRLRPVLEEIIAAGRQQFQQPYKQISIPKGGLIILKPSPNSQLLNRQEQQQNDNQQQLINIQQQQQQRQQTNNTPTVVPQTPGTPQSMHEGTPDNLNEDTPMTPMTPIGAVINNRSERETSTPFSPVSMRSPANSLADECGGSPRPQLAHSSSMELELNISLMEMETNNNANKGGNINVPPPPPPPPPPGGGGGPLPVSANVHQKIAPAPLPTPPNSIDQSPSLSQPILQQFIPPPQKINPQILFAKQQLESPNSKHDSSKPTGPVRAGPKGQFIWPPVSVQSSNSSGTVTIRANRSLAANCQVTNTTTCTTAASITPQQQPPINQHQMVVEEQMSSSTPVAQLAAVFSLNPAGSSPPMPMASQHQAVVSLSHHHQQLQQSSSAPNLKALVAQGPASSSSAGPQQGPATTKISLAGTGQPGSGMKLASSSSIQLPSGGIQFGTATNLPPNIRLPQEPIPVSELCYIVKNTATTTFASSAVHEQGQQHSLPSTSVSQSAATIRYINAVASQLPTTLPTNNAILQQQQHENNMIQQQHQVVSDNSGDISYQNSNSSNPPSNIGGSVIILPPINAVPASSYGGQTSSGLQVSMAASSPTVLVPASMDPARFQVPQTTTTSLNYNTNSILSSNVANSQAVSIASSQQNGIIVSNSHPSFSVVPSSSGGGVGNVMMTPAPMVNGAQHSQSTQEIIKQQQQQIEELTRALEKSRQMLIQTQNQQQASGKVQISRHLQKRQLTNQITQLQNQIVSKAQQQKAVLMSSAMQQHQLNNSFSQKENDDCMNDEAQLNQSMDEFIENILKNGFSDGSCSSQQSGSAPPPPPPPPVGAARSKDGLTTPPSSKLHQPTTPSGELSPQLPQLLDFTDLTFDLGQLTDLTSSGGWPGITALQPSDNGASNGLGLGTSEHTTNGHTGGVEDDVNMDVDMDVADWLDSLLPPVNGSGSSGM